MSMPVATETPPTGSPQAIALPVSPFVACDAHAEPTTQALFEIALPNGKHLAMCGHHAYKHFGVLEQTWIHGETKTKGSSH
jgi:hypothetical protein